MSTTTYPKIFDGHNDTLLTLYLRERGPEASFFTRSDRGHLDLPRAREGGFGGGFFAVWVPPEKMPETGGEPIGVSQFPTRATGLDPNYSLRTAVGMASILFRIEAASNGEVKVVRTSGELERCLADGTLAAILHFEGAEAIDPDLNALEVFYQAGLRSLGIVWSRPNAFAEGVPFQFPSSPDTGPGLTDAGKELVRACNRLGVMLDLSHLNETGFWDVAALTDAPLVATHSNVHALCPSARNLTDRQLAAIKESDGMVGLNYHVGFTRADGQRNLDTPLELYVDHLDYLVAHLGIDRVGLGSDFDGCAIPSAMGDVTGQPKLLAAIAARGYDAASLRKIAHENWVRVLAKTWRG